MIPKAVEAAYAVTSLKHDNSADVLNPCRFICWQAAMYSWYTGCGRWTCQQTCYKNQRHFSLEERSVACCKEEFVSGYIIYFCLWLMQCPWGSLQLCSWFQCLQITLAALCGWRVGRWHKRDFTWGNLHGELTQTFLSCASSHQALGDGATREDRKCKCIPNLVLCFNFLREKKKCRKFDQTLFPRFSFMFLLCFILFLNPSHTGPSHQIAGKEIILNAPQHTVFRSVITVVLLTSFFQLLN